MPRIRTSHLPALLVAGVLLLSACGSSDTTPAKATTTKAPEPTTTTLPGRCDWEFNTASYWAKNPPVKPDDEVQHMGNEHGAQPWAPLTDTSKCDTLRSELATMDDVMAKFPTAQDALDFGCYRATVYVAGIAAHYVCIKHISGTPDTEKPLMLLYGGSEPTAPIVGLSYMMFTKESPNTASDSALWAKYMPWHYHEGLCTDPKTGLVIGGDHTPKDVCEARGGKVGGQTGWMGHYWPKNCPSPDGVFSADNPRLDWEVAKYNDDPTNAKNTKALLAAPCQGSKMVIEPAGDDRFGKPQGMSDRAQLDGESHDDHGSHSDDAAHGDEGHDES